MSRRQHYGRSTTGITPLSAALLIAGSVVTTSAAPAASSPHITPEQTSQQLLHSTLAEELSARQSQNVQGNPRTDGRVSRPPAPTKQTVSKKSPSTRESIWKDRLFYGLIIFALGHVLVPTWRYYWSRHIQRTNYMRWLRAGVDSSLSRYGEPVDDSVLNKLNNLSANHHTWYKNLSDKGYPVPSMLVDLHSALQKYREGMADCSPYIPYFTFVVNDDRKMDHDHPIWLMDKERSNVVTRYLTSQAQIKSSLKDTYSSPLYDLSSHEDMKKREQWAHSFEFLLEDACENFVATIELHRNLESWGFRSEGKAAKLFDGAE
ncbi:hypothetical protein OCL06_15975 [Alteromonas sp. ASW11-19]|uniref:Uncharacterized protein n=1 Tax=Alteromonas salexigens TaxID=2982530 RepID=A0ABT2VRZ2_9ALTE|nr:hypothetical protein [Alteromonas salexigens]MCU7556090.1 hypothetical protein [Alteromonas salexigens]